MCRHTETNNLVLCTVLVKLRRSMAVVAVDDKQAVDPSCTRRSMFIKVLQPEQTKLVSCPAVVAYCKYPVSRHITIPAGLV